MGFSDSNSQFDDARQRDIYIKARELLNDHSILLRALGPEGVDFINHGNSSDYLDELSALLLGDDAEGIGRIVIDQVVHYVWALAEQELGRADEVSTH